MKLFAFHCRVDFNVQTACAQVNTDCKVWKALGFAFDSSEMPTFIYGLIITVTGSDPNKQFYWEISTLKVIVPIVKFCTCKLTYRFLGRCPAVCLFIISL